MNFEQARFNMVEQQLRPWDVLDQNVLDLLYVVKREEFVPQAYRQLAFADTEIPLGHGATMLPPKLEARTLQALGIRKSDRVLEIGTGSGYMAALLATHAAHVVTVEIIPELAESAVTSLKRRIRHDRPRSPPSVPRDRPAPEGIPGYRQGRQCARPGYRDRG